MGKKLTKEQLAQRVYDRSLKTCEYVSGEMWGTLTIKCLKHNLTFNTEYENIKRKDKSHHLCPECQKEDREERYKDHHKTVKCDYCGKEFKLRNNRAEASSSGLHFCCRDCKDKAQQISSGEKFKNIRPSHYKDGSYLYRERAFKEYPHKCAVCGWSEDEDVLEVHHIDSNRKHNSLDNLIILCPTCHKKLTLGKYSLSKNRKSIIKK